MKLWEIEKFPRPLEEAASCTCLCKHLDSSHICNKWLAEAATDRPLHGADDLKFADADFPNWAMAEAGMQTQGGRSAVRTPAVEECVRMQHAKVQRGQELRSFKQQENQAVAVVSDLTELLKASSPPTCGSWHSRRTSIN